ncbi:MAG: UDP-N-acetylmuramate:L-alanyl-gamma-D-glutamyl-meso-diaminopimelate ligase, partial [Gammaproteobacteria bacterium]
MRLHILGICGTFMGGLALLARSLGHEVRGSDRNVYPPMSDQLREQGIELLEGDDPAHLEPAPDRVIIGNALSRGHPQVEAVLDRGLPYTSGPQWLAEEVLAGRWVLAVSGTHGKTTTSSLLAHLLQAGGLEPGFLIGGVPLDFGVSARLGGSPFFVVEADEYDSAFFDKRSKFVHYRPRTLVINNIEYDHADIFPDLASIQRQFYHLVRTVPGSGLILRRQPDAAIDQTLALGCWSEVAGFSTGEQAKWRAEALVRDWSRFRVFHEGEAIGDCEWSLIGRFNAENALAAIAAARHAGVPPSVALPALTGFRGVRRRLELLGEPAGVRVYDDFAHHPTAIAATLEALRERVGEARIIAVLEPRSNTMRAGVHRETLAGALALADRVLLYRPQGLEWDLEAATATLPARSVHRDTAEIIERLRRECRRGDHVVILSNGGFEGLHRRLLTALAQLAPGAADSTSTDHAEEK